VETLLDGQLVDNADLLKLPILVIRIPYCLIARVCAGENLDLATAIIIKPFDALFSWMLVILEYLGSFGHCTLSDRRPDRRRTH
jgi:hypothetical protein